MNKPEINLYQTLSDAPPLPQDPFDKDVIDLLSLIALTQVTIALGEKTPSEVYIAQIRKIDAIRVRYGLEGFI